MKIAVAGIGYVGLSIAILLAQKNKVIAVDTDGRKVELVNRGEAPIRDREASEYLKKGTLNLTATLNAAEAYRDADFIVVATPTNYDTEKKFFDVSSVEAVLQAVEEINSNAVIVIKSTVPVGYTKTAKEKFKHCNLIFSPEFLREGHALYDNLYPSRIIVGRDGNQPFLCKKAEEFANLLREGALKKDVELLLFDSTEAEAVKLFANTYLALRVAYFNELDTYAEEKGLDTKNIIDGICLDPRIRQDYNNPSLGYGGYCLPKDTKQLLANYKDVPQNLIEAIVKSNETRKKYVSERVYNLSKRKIKNRRPIIGIYRIIMKAGSDNFRQSAVQDVISDLSGRNVDVVIYEPLLKSDKFMDNKIENDLNRFKEMADIIVANRYDGQLSDVKEKLYTRDIFGRD